MNISPLTAMQAAVDAVGTSPHPDNKIAACLFGSAPGIGPFSIVNVNRWPDAIERAFGRETRIGSSSGTLHAETACILQAPVTAGASLAITDPFCPNCAKNIAEAGIRTVYLDHKGFEKDFAARRADDFLNLSLSIMRHAGIGVVEVRRKEGKLIPLFTPEVGAEPVETRPVHPLTPENRAFSADELMGAAATFHPQTPGLPFAAGWGVDGAGKPTILIAEPHLSAGFSETTLLAELAREQITPGKYSLVMEPVNRLMMAAARLGLRLDPRLVVSSRTPTSRELVNMVGAGLTTLCILNVDAARDMAAMEALTMLTAKGVMTLLPPPARG